MPGRPSPRTAASRRAASPPAPATPSPCRPTAQSRWRGGSEARGRTSSLSASSQPRSPQRRTARPPPRPRPTPPVSPAPPRRPRPCSPGVQTVATGWHRPLGRPCRCLLLPARPARDGFLDCAGMGGPPYVRRRFVLWAHPNLFNSFLKYLGTHGGTLWRFSPNWPRRFLSVWGIKAFFSFRFL